MTVLIHPENNTYVGLGNGWWQVVTPDQPTELLPHAKTNRLSDDAGVDTIDLSHALQLAIQSGYLVVLGDSPEPGHALVFDRDYFTSLVIDGVIENAYGSKYGDVIHGNNEDNILAGGKGKDYLFGNGGDDVFDFNSVRDSRHGHADSVDDFTHGQDTIDLRDIDANHQVKGNQAFHFVGVFHERAGELIVDHGRILGDVDGDARADLVINIHGANIHSGDFIF